MSSIGQGGTIRLDAVYRNGAGQLVDPLAPSVTITDTNGTVVVSGAAPTQNLIDGTPQTGVYYYDLTVDADAPLGTWTASWDGVINGSLVGAVDTFEVVAAGAVIFDAASTPLATAGDLAAWMGLTIEEGSADEARATMMVAAASGMVRGETRQTLSQVIGDTQRLRGCWGHDLWLPQRPVSAVSAVLVDGVALDNDEWELAPHGILRRLGGSWSSSRGMVALGGWGGPDTTVTVTYTHGWATIPDDIKTAVLMLAARGWVNPAGNVSESVGAYSVSFGGGNTLRGMVMTDAERALLRRYRRRQAVR